MIRAPRFTRACLWLSLLLFLSWTLPALAAVLGCFLGMRVLIWLLGLPDRCQRRREAARRSWFFNPERIKQ